MEPSPELSLFCPATGNIAIGQRRSSKVHKCRVFLPSVAKLAHFTRLQSAEFPLAAAPGANLDRPPADDPRL
jgi:hypothetical protein